MGSEVDAGEGAEDITRAVECRWAASSGLLVDDSGLVVKVTVGLLFRLVDAMEMGVGTEEPKAAAVVAACIADVARC